MYSLSGRVGDIIYEIQLKTVMMTFSRHQAKTVVESGSQVLSLFAQLCFLVVSIPKKEEARIHTNNHTHIQAPSSVHSETDQIQQEVQYRLIIAQ